MEKIINPILEEEIIFNTTSKQSNGDLTLAEVTIGPTGNIFLPAKRALIF